MSFITVNMPTKVSQFPIITRVYIWFNMFKLS